MSDYRRHCEKCDSTHMGNYHVYVVPAGQKESVYIGQHLICDYCNHIQPDADAKERTKKLIDSLYSPFGRRDY